MKVTRALLAAVVLAALAPAAAPAATAEPPHGGPHPDAGSPAGVRPVTITDAGMSPAQVVVAPGTRITWTNSGLRRHTSTSDAGLWDSPLLATGDSFSVRAPAERGDYGYACRLHANMRGTVTVSSVALAEPEAVPVGGRAVLSGTAPGLPEGTPVRIELRRAGAWEAVREVPIAAEGAFTATTPPLSRRTAVRAVVAGSPSPARRIAVHPRVTLGLRAARLTVRVRPGRAGQPVVLERLDLDTYRWHPHARARLGPRRTVTLGLHAPGVYRARVPARAGLDTTHSGVVEFRPSHFHIG